MFKVLILSESEIEGQILTSALSDLSLSVECVTSEGGRGEVCGSCDLLILLSTARFWDREQVLSQFRRADGTRPKVYLLSWQCAVSTAVAMLDSGVSQYITMPLNVGRLRHKVLDEIRHAL